MNKCDWCATARRDPKTGRLVCPYMSCMLSQADIINILKSLAGMQSPGVFGTISPAEEDSEVVYQNMVRNIIIEQLEKIDADTENEYNWDVRETLPEMSPSKVIEILETFGWTRDDDWDSNGWEQDTWYNLSHPDKDYRLTLFYCGFYGDIHLGRKESEW